MKIKASRLLQSVLLSICAGLLATNIWAQDKAKPDAVYRNGYIYTVDAYRSSAQAVAVLDGKFIKIGTNEELKEITGPDTKVIDLKGKMVMPSIVDAHIHPLRGGLAHFNFCQFDSSATIAQIQDKIKACVAKKKKKGEWLEGSRWSASLVNKVRAEMLDKVSPDNPVLLHDNTNHLIWVNSAALKAAKITKDTPDPPGGKILRDPKSGEPTGVLTEKAAVLITKQMPPPQEKELEQAAEWIFGKLNSYGVTAIATAQGDAGRLKAYRTMEKKNQLTVRIKMHWDWNTRYAPVPLDQMAALFATREKRGPRTELIDPDGVKIYTDGVPNGHGSPFIEPYIDGDGKEYGPLYINQADLSTAITHFDAEGLSVMLHCAGDQAVRNSLNAIEAARRKNGSGGPRHQLSHNFLVHPLDMPRAAELNVSQDLSPTDLLYPNDMTLGYAASLGRERVNRSAAVKSMLEAGSFVSYGSDWDNIPDPDPWLALQTLITRRNPEHPSLGQSAPNEAVDVPTALEMLTYSGAFSMGLEKVTGSIEVGKSADFIVIDQNILEVPVEKIHKTKVLQTVLQGKTVYKK